MSQPRSTVTRRRFLATTAKVGAIFAAPVLIPGRALGKSGAVAASERIALAGIGIRNRGGYDLGFMLAEPVVQFVAIADVRKDRREAVKALAEAKYGPGVAMYRDFREMLPRQDIDAVLIATGDRWHAVASILAAKAGKDIYSEKPCAITIALARDLAEAMRRQGRVFQAGTQRRNVANFRWAVELARSGKLGKLHTLHASIYELLETHDWLPAEPEPPRDIVDWDLWLGPAPWRPYNHRYVDGEWRACFDFDSGAKLLDWGAHTVDLCQWALGADGTTPVEFEPIGTNHIVGRYANGVKLVLRQGGWLGLGTCPVRFEGDEGWVETGDSGQIAVYPESLRCQRPAVESGDKDDSMLQQIGVGISPKYHIRDFLSCVKTRRQPATNADVARSSHVACHAAYISWLLGRKITFDPAKEEFIGNEEANRMRSRPLREPWQI
jgi:predicted dehydrogenase